MIHPFIERQTIDTCILTFSDGVSDPIQTFFMCYEFYIKTNLMHFCKTLPLTTCHYLCN